MKDRNLKLQPENLRNLLLMATSGMLFTFDGQLYEQIDGVSMGSPLGPLFANFFLGHMEDCIFGRSLPFAPKYYKRYVDDTFLLFSSSEHIEPFLASLNAFHPSIQFTIENAVENVLPFIGVSVSIVDDEFVTSVYHKSCDKGIFLHSKSFCDEKYKKNLMPMLCHRAFTLSSSWIGFHQEIERSMRCLEKLGYCPSKLGQQVRPFSAAKFAAKCKERYP